MRAASEAKCIHRVCSVRFHHLPNIGRIAWLPGRQIGKEGLAVIGQDDVALLAGLALADVDGAAVGVEVAATAAGKARHSARRFRERPGPAAGSQACMR